MSTSRMMRGLAGRVVLLAAVVPAACGHGHGPKVHRDSWWPEEKDQPMAPPVVYAALLLRTDGDIDVLNRAGATLIGWHTATNQWSTRAASTGGTHFAPVLPPERVRPGCYSWGNAPLCSAGKKARHWTRIAVFRLSPDRWHALPAHLVPTDGVVAAGIAASAVRAGCGGVHGQYGSVRCPRAGWRVVTNPAVAANVPPLAYQADGPGTDAPRGPTEDESDAEFEAP